MVKGLIQKTQFRLQEAFSYQSVILLILANTIPIIGVLFFHWSFGDILFLYWIESGVVGFFNVLRMLLVEQYGGLSPKFLTVPFFVLHFGIFMFAHGMFLLALLRISDSILVSRDIINLYDVFRQEYFAFFGLFISHGFSFVKNYLIGGEWRKTSLSQLSMQPYSRILVMHIIMIFSIFVILIFRQPIWLLILFVMVKLTLDLSAHVKERLKFKLAESYGRVASVPAVLLKSASFIKLKREKERSLRIFRILDTSTTLFLLAIIGGAAFLHVPFLSPFFEDVYIFLNLVLENYE